MDWRVPALLLALLTVVLVAGGAGTHYEPPPSPGDDTTWIVVGGANLTAWLADTPGERYCGYYCYDTPAIIFTWPEGAPSTVTFTMEGIGYPITLLHVRNCTVIDVVVMEPDRKYTIEGVEPGDWFVEVKGRFDTPIGAPVYTPLCAREG